jgi:hypothetical protein
MTMLSRFSIGVSSWDVAMGRIATVGRPAGTGGKRPFGIDKEYALTRISRDATVLWNKTPIGSSRR